MSAEGTTAASLTERDALRLTERINKRANELCWLVEQAHDQEAWRALGHSDFKEYVAVRLVISEKHAYRLLDQAKVIRELEAAAGIEHSAGTRVSHRQVEAVKARLPKVTAAVSERVDAGEAPDQAIAVVVEREAKEFAEKKAARRQDADDLAVKVSKALDRLINLIGEEPSMETRIVFLNQASKVARLRSALDRAVAYNAAADAS